MALELEDLHPDGIPYPDAPPEALEWIEQKLARLISTPEGGRIDLSTRGLIKIGEGPEGAPAPAEEEDEEDEDDEDHDEEDEDDEDEDED